MCSSVILRNNNSIHNPIDCPLVPSIVVDYCPRPTPVVTHSLSPDKVAGLWTNFAQITLLGGAVCIKNSQISPRCILDKRKQPSSSLSRIIQTPDQHKSCLCGSKGSKVTLGVFRVSHMGARHHCCHHCKNISIITTCPRSRSIPGLLYPHYHHHNGSATSHQPQCCSKKVYGFHQNTSNL